jgi:hypothetical protein
MEAGSPTPGSLSRNESTRHCSEAARVASSRAVAARSSAERAFSWVTRPTSFIAVFTCETALDCSSIARATLWARRAVSRTDARTSSSNALARTVASRLPRARERISVAADALRSARRRTSVATTAKPRPCAPA